MKRIDTASKSTDLFGTGKHGFTNGTPGVVAPTAVDDSFLNHVQEEVARTIEAGGCAVAGGANYDQLAGHLQMGEILALFSARRITTPGTATLHAIAGGLSSSYRMVAVGASAAIYVMGVSGSVASGTPGSSYAGDFNGVVVVPGLSAFVAVGDAGEIQSGPAAWTRQKTGGDDLNAIAHGTPGGDDVLVAVGQNGDIWEATNSLATWNDRTAADALGGGHLYDVIWAESLGLFIACGQGGIQTSPDGIVWTQRYATNTYTVSWNDALGYAVAHATPSGADRYIYSADGITWTSSGVAAPAGSPSLGLMCRGGLVNFNQVVRFVDGVPSSNLATSPVLPNEALDLRTGVYDPYHRCWWACGANGAISMTHANSGV